MDINALLQLADVGSTGILLVILFALWQDYRVQNQFIREQLMQSHAERAALAEAMGIQPRQLQAMAEKHRQRLENAPLN